MFQSKNKLSIVCPFYSEGFDFSDKVDTIRDTIARITGGASQFMQRGVWFHGLDCFDEPSIVLYSFCNDEQLEELSPLFEAWAKLLNQIELLVTIEQVKIALVKSPVLQEAA